MILFDTHCHLTDPDFDDDRPAVLQGMAEAGVRHAAVIGYDLTSSRAALAFVQDQPGFCAAVGIHPEHADTLTDAVLQELREMAVQHPDTVRAIGEIGLDVHDERNPDKTIQISACVRQMALAKELGLPVCFHVRDAQMDMLNLLKTHKDLITGGIMHCFSGSWEIAQEYLKLGYFISFAGPVTFKKAPRLQEVAVRVPLDRILIETDSPYMAPEPVRGHRNNPANVRLICEKIAGLRGMTAEEMAEITTANAMRLYGLA